MFSSHVLRKAVEVGIERGIDNRLHFPDVDTQRNTYNDARKLVDLKFRGMWKGTDILVVLLLVLFFVASIGLLVRTIYQYHNPLLAELVILSGVGFLSVEWYYIRQRIIVARQELESLLRLKPHYWRPLLKDVEEIILEARSTENVPSHW